jgi:hypothetical protein
MSQEERTYKTKEDKKEESSCEDGEAGGISVYCL